ncbi:signal transduction histidine kinase [Paraburkholderia youngii]|uniref:ATP-binding protein n=1 Tax=Paraburkholderia youngii TaxID=2782701 RepID=UPI003D22D31E
MNAMQAMSGLENGPRLIRICTEVLEGREVRLSIQDSGPGIAFEDREQLFRPFFTTKANDMGMGLSICRSIVEAHGGNIGADVASVVGAVFRITLPLYTGPEESRGTAAMKGALSGSAR